MPKLSKRDREMLRHRGLRDGWYVMLMSWVSGILTLAACIGFVHWALGGGNLYSWVGSALIATVLFLKAGKVAETLDD